MLALAHLPLPAGPQSSARRPVVLPGHVSIDVVGTSRDDRHLRNYLLARWLAIVAHHSSRLRLVSGSCGSNTVASMYSLLV